MTGGTYVPRVGDLIGPGLEPDPAFGELRLSYSGGLRCTVNRADPRVRLSGSLVREALGDNPVPGQRIIIDTEDRRIIYVIGTYHEAEPGDWRDWWEAHWPD